MDSSAFLMKNDIGETKNLVAEKPEVVEKLLGLLKKDVIGGRSTDGAEAQNDVEEIVLWKSGETEAKAPKPAPAKKKKPKKKKEA